MRSGRPGSGREASVRRRATQLLYKVVELSTVDEQTIESTVNEWIRKGWNLDGIQFAMRESSKRPSMAFVFFTRDEELGDDTAATEPDLDGATARLQRLALAGATHAVATAPEGSLLPTLSGDEPEADLHLFRELDPEELERAADDRIWSSQPERSANAWQRQQELANAADDDEGSKS